MLLMGQLQSQFNLLTTLQDQSYLNLTIISVILARSGMELLETIRACIKRVRNIQPHMNKTRLFFFTGVNHQCK